ncbi:MAG: insulinase family protein [Acidobacteriota bacterium]|nr:insulinase family protein [Acidobacteriota bacterium]
MNRNLYKLKLLFISLIVFALTTTIVAQKSKKFVLKSESKSMNSNIASVFQPSKSPLVSFRIQFLTGAVDDPKGKEGLANLTAAMLANGGSKKLTYDEVVEQFYPMATGFGYQVDKEMTTFVGTTHADNLAKYYGLISQMLLDAGFREDDFKRIKQDAINSLKVGLRESNDEELGKERLYNIIYKNHPYEHYTIGNISSLEKMTLSDVKDFYKQNYTQANLVIGLSGGFDTTFSKQITADFAKLPNGKKMARNILVPKLEAGMKIDIVERETRATAISLGFPIAVNRADKDYAALALVASYFGQHRSSNSYLYGQLREKRGLNYGDYAYIEYFPRGMFQFQPDPNLARQQQIFQIWIRPVEPQNANFALRATLYEFDKLVKNGITKATFEETRDFLIKFVNVLTQTKDAELGYALDSRYYGIPNFNEYMKTALAKLTLADVNNAIKKHFSTNKMRIVMITKDAKDLRETIVNNKPAHITYIASKPQEILTEDAIIATYPINVKPENVTITPVEKVFQ